MAKFEVNLPDQQYNDIDGLIEAGDFLNWQQATEELLAMGLNSYATDENTEVAVEEEIFTDAIEDEQDPAGRDDPRGGDRTL